MNNRPRNHMKLLTLAALAGAFARPGHDPMLVPEPDSGEWKNVCNAIFGGVGRESVHSPEGDGEPGGGGAGGGAPKTFTQEQVDRIVQERLKGPTEKLKLLEPLTGELATLKTQLAELTGAADKAREEAELKGKTELEQLQIKLNKGTDAYKRLEAEREAERTKLSSEVAAEKAKLVDYVKRGHAVESLTKSGALGDAVPDAAAAFLSAVQIDIDDKHGIAGVTYEGKPFANVAEAAKAFLKAKPYYAAPVPGGSGGPRNPKGGPAPKDFENSSPEELITAGLSAPPRAGGAIPGIV